MEIGNYENAKPVQESNSEPLSSESTMPITILSQRLN